MTRAEKKKLADEKQEKYKDIVILAFLKSIDIFETQQNVSIKTAFSIGLNAWDKFIDIFCKKDSKNAHIIRSVSYQAKKELQEMLMVII